MLQDSPQINLSRAEHLLEQGQCEAAHDRFKVILAAEPENPAAQVGLARALSALDQPARAREAWRQYLQACPADARAWADFGRFLLELDSHDQAASALRKALRIDPSQPADWTLLGRALERGRHEEPAMQAFKKALRMDPHDVEAWCHLGELYIRKGQAGLALRLWKQALKGLDHHEQSPILARMGVAYARGGLWKEARVMLERAIARGEGDSRYVFALGVTCHHLGAEGEARMQLEILKTMGSDKARKLARVFERPPKAPAENDTRDEEQGDTWAGSVSTGWQAFGKGLRKMLDSNTGQPQGTDPADGDSAEALDGSNPEDTWEDVSGLPATAEDVQPGEARPPRTLPKGTGLGQIRT